MVDRRVELDKGPFRAKILCPSCEEKGEWRAVFFVAAGTDLIRVPGMEGVMSVCSYTLYRCWECNAGLIKFDNEGVGEMFREI